MNKLVIPVILVLVIIVIAGLLYYQNQSNQSPEYIVLHAGDKLVYCENGEPSNYIQVVKEYNDTLKISIYFINQFGKTSIIPKDKPLVQAIWHDANYTGQETIEWNNKNYTVDVYTYPEIPFTIYAYKGIPLKITMPKHTLILCNSTIKIE